MDRDPLVQLPPELAPSRAGRQGEAQARGDARFVLGIDGGATKTLAAVLDLQEKTLHLGHGGPSNEDAVGTRAAVQALLEAADAAIGQTGAGGDRLDAAVIAMAGTDTDAVARHVRAERSEGWLVVNDVVAAWATATGGRPGIGVISGTGSNVFGVGESTGSDPPSWRAGGWGHMLGDEGGGYWLGTESIKAALRDRESSGPETRLSEAAPEFFGAPSVEALAAQVYSKPLSKREIAAFATETAKLARDGDVVAREIYERGARVLGEQVAAVIARTGLQGAFPVGLIGSAFKAGAVLVEPLTRAVHELAPDAEVSVVEMAPVAGSLLLALRASGCEQALSAEQLGRLVDEALATSTSGAA